MRKPFYIFAGIVAAFAVVLAVTLSLTASDSTKKNISESIPHGSKEKPIGK